MKNTKLRNQCADIIRYIRRHNKHGLSRVEVETDQCFLPIDYYTLKDFIDASKSIGIDPHKLFFRYFEKEDYDGYTGGVLMLYTYTIMSDSEYFDYLCECILPSEYEVNEYKQYLMLKQKYEGEQ